METTLIAVATSLRVFPPSMFPMNIYAILLAKTNMMINDKIPIDTMIFKAILYTTSLFMYSFKALYSLTNLDTAIGIPHVDRLKKIEYME